MTTTPPGWYDDGHGTMRWWDGTQWTEHVADPLGEERDASGPGRRDVQAAEEPPAGSEPVHATPGFAAPFTVGASAAARTPGYEQYGGAPVALADPATGPGPGGPFAAASERRKSKLWIVWLALGVVVLGILIGVVLVPLLLTAASGPSGQSAGVTVEGADQQAAVAVVEMYDDAWQRADCDAYLASTTEGFRTQSGLPDCSAFETQAEAFAAAVDDYRVTMTDVHEQSGDILVATTETYKMLVGEDGEPLDEPADESIDWMYVVVETDGGWLIDDLR